MAGTPYALNYVAPQARDAQRDILAQLAIDAAGPYPELHVAAEDLSIGDHLFYRPQGSAWKIIRTTRPGETYVRAVEMRSLGYAPARDAVWLDLSHGYELISEEEVAAEIKEMQDRDEMDRADRWGGHYDD